MYSIDVLVIAGVVSVITGLIKKVIPEKIKSLIGLIPFILGIILYGLYSYFILNLLDVFCVISKGFQCGGVATLYYTFFKQILSSSGSVKKAVQDVLKGVLSTSAIKDVANLITKNFSHTDSDEETENTVRQILTDNADIPTEVSSAIAKIITVTLSGKKK